MNSQIVQFWCRTKIGVGRHALDHLVYDLNSMDAKKPLVITWKDPHGEDSAKPLVKAFRGSGMTLGIYDGVTRSSNMETVRGISRLYRDRGFDSIIVLGQGMVMDVAKVVNLAVSGSPNNLKRCAGKDKIPGPLNPLVHVATGVGRGKETSRRTFLAGLAYDSFFMMPDMAVVDPRAMLPQTRESVQESALILMVSLVEAYATTRDPMVRSYAFTGARLVMENFDAIIHGRETRKPRLFKFSSGDDVSICLAQASVISGYILSNMECLVARELGELVSGYCTASPGECMLLLLPHVLTFMAGRGGADTEKLLLALEGMELYSATPLKQRSGHAVYFLQSLINTLFVTSKGRFPRSLKDAGMTDSSFSKVLDFIGTSPLEELEVHECRTIIEGALESSPAFMQPEN